MKRIIIIICLLLSGCIKHNSQQMNIPEYNGQPFIILNHNQVEFDKEDYKTESFIHLSPLDSLGRVQEAFACLSIDTMPKENDQREAIGMIKPSGWHTVRYDDLIEDKYLYNRCHLLAWSLSQINADERNLMSGTRSFNIDGMLPFENMIASYIKETHHHVLYKVTPLFNDFELVARGVQLQAISLEDDQIELNVFIYNVQKGIEINYQTGESQRINEIKEDENIDNIHIINISSHVIHRTNCSVLENTYEKNKRITTIPINILQLVGYKRCMSCHP